MKNHLSRPMQIFTNIILMGNSKKYSYDRYDPSHVNMVLITYSILAICNSRLMTFSSRSFVLVRPFVFKLSDYFKSLWIKIDNKIIMNINIA